MAHLKSKCFDNLRGKPLTDARILHYTRLGKYGESAQLNLQTRELLERIRSLRRSKHEHITSVPVSKINLDKLAEL